MNKKIPYKKSVRLRHKKLKYGNISLYLDIYSGGKRQYEFLGITYNPKNISDKRQKLNIAREIRANRELELLNSIDGVISNQKKKLNYIEYFKKLVDEYKKPNSKKTWKNTLNYLIEYTSGYIQFYAINETWLEELKKFLLTKVSNNTAFLYFSKIKYSLKRAIQDKIINYNSSDYIKPIKRRFSEKVYLTLDELTILARTVCKHNSVKLAFLFCCNTGLRLSDIKKLSWNNVSFTENKIMIKQEKTGKNVYIPLSISANNILERIREDKYFNIDKRIFNLPPDTTINYTIKQWIKKVNINKKITFHTSRHTFATLSLSMGVDLYIISDLLGHKDVKTTQIYAKIIDKSKEKAILKLPDIEVI